MFRLSVPFTDTRLVFTPPLDPLPVWLQLGLFGGGLLVTIALLVWLYSYELRLLSRHTAFGLLAFRIATLGFLWLLCLQPIVSRPSNQRIIGRVLVALDRSDSMLVADPQRDPAEKLRLARGLAVASDLVRESQVNDWLKQYADTGRVSFPATPAGQSERALHNQVCTRIDPLTRLQIAREVLIGSRIQLIKRLSEHHSVELVAFSQESAPFTAESLVELLQSSKPANAYTDLRLPLARALETAGTSEGRIVGVVVLSDGRHNWGPPPAAKATDLGKLGVPIFPIAIGSRIPPSDIAITAIQSPTSVFKGSEVPIEVRVQVTGISKRELVVQLQFPGQELLEERVAHDGTNATYTVKFTPKLDQVGTQTLTATAKAQNDELRSDNNSRPLVVNVADDTAKVLLIDGEARWEFHYLASVLARDKSIVTKAVVFSQPRINSVPEDELSRIGYPALKLPAEADAFTSYDAVILGDVAPDQIPSADRQRLEAYVAEHGGTLVILAGKRAMPLAFAVNPADREADPIVKMLPIKEAREVRPLEGFQLAFTGEGRLTGFLQLEATVEQSTQRWSELPRHYWGVVGKVKPGATSLAYFREAPASTPAEETELERSNAIICRQNYGFGRVMFVGLDSTWRWRYRTGDTYHHRFWGQVLRWAASDRPLVAGNDFVRFGTREPLYRTGQDIEVVARLSEIARALGPGALAGVRLTRHAADGKTEPAGMVPLTRRDGRPREREAKVRDLVPGRYTMELAIPDIADQLNAPSGQLDKMRAGFTVDAPQSEEITDLATNRTLLEDMAARTGGEVFEAEDAARLVEKLTSQVVERQFRNETHLGRSYWTLIVFVLLLSVEWVVRKLNGLP